MATTKPPAREITKAREAAKRRRKTPGERRTVAARSSMTPTKKRPAGQSGLTRNAALERPAPPAPSRPTRRSPENLRVGKRTPKSAHSARRAESAKKH